MKTYDNHTFEIHLETESELMQWSEFASEFWAMDKKTGFKNSSFSKDTNKFLRVLLKGFEPIEEKKKPIIENLDK